MEDKGPLTFSVNLRLTMGASGTGGGACSEG
jgi:hypothetical protein